MAADPAVGAATVRARSAQRRADELAATLALLRRAVLRECGDAVLPDPRTDGAWRAAETVSVLVHRCQAALRDIPADQEQRAERVCGLVLDLQRLALDLYLHDTAQRSGRLADCAAGLNRLRSVPDPAALLDLACGEIVLRCGFQRVVLSRVGVRSWSPWLSHFAADAGAGSWITEWIDQQIPLEPTAPEARLLTDRRASLVQDTASAGVYRPIIVDAGHSRSYVVAPVLHGDEVVGIVHADHHPSARRADETDRDILWAFTDGFGHLYERTVLLDRLRSRRDHARELVGAAVRRMDELCETGTVLARDNDREGAAGTAPGAHPESGLTVREAEVLRLMADGRTNRAIADRLVITEGTVKSHVKHILRKLGAVNRAQAIAWSLARG
ncbi:LuxR C-terminal-related transcriptional regulator [Nocardia sp. NPDC057227]|uniref:helix-turn-helix transcriptional regulator n=1 Tax=Nocardia sp. NPDC057227 TaxID=3346056 RepID=UPI003633E48B